MRRFLLPPTPITSVDEYLAGDLGGLGLQRAQEIGPAETIAEVARAGLGGRGGGGFPTGRKWASTVDQPGSHRYVVCNGAEGEPGMFKDRALMRANPYQLVEGVLIAAYAVGAVGVYICLKASFELDTRPQMGWESQSGLPRRGQAPCRRRSSPVAVALAGGSVGGSGHQG